MNFGISGRSALVCASSKGLGYQCALALAHEGVNVTLTGRSEDSLLVAVDSILRTVKDVNVNYAVGDLSTSEGREAACVACPGPDILVNNNGGPAVGKFRDWLPQDWSRALDSNMIAPIEMIRATVDGMVERKWGRIVNITASTVKAPKSVLGLSSGARAGLTAFVSSIASELAANGVIVNSLLPGPFTTDRMQAVIQAAPQMSSLPPVGRYGDPAEFGAVCAFLCSQHVGYMVGQNILLDGGDYKGCL